MYKFYIKKLNTSKELYTPYTVTEITTDPETKKEVEVINAEACPDHIHMYVSIPPKISISSFMGYLKGKSTLIIFERHANLKYKYGNRTFWCRGFYVSTVGNNKTAVYNYVENQLKEDMQTDQITIKEYKDPFKG